jgi:hypothetical protein
MPEYKRFGNRWTINEYLQLQREFELLQLSIGEIAKRHKRTPNAIMIKLDQEGLADYDDVYFNYTNRNSTKKARKIERTNNYDYLFNVRKLSSDELRNYTYNEHEYEAHDTESETESENESENDVESESENVVENDVETESEHDVESEVETESDSDESSAKEEIQVKETKSNSMKKLKQQVMKIEEQLSQLNKFLLNQTKEKKQSKTVFSLFG